MHTYLVSPEPRRSDDARTFTAEANASDMTIDGHHATVPLSVEALLLLEQGENLSPYTMRLRLETSFVPTQRITAQAPSGNPFPASVISMESRGDNSSPRVVLTAKAEFVPTDSTGDIPGWQPVPNLSITEEWANMVRISKAVEADVQYLLASPVIVGVRLHNLDTLYRDDITNWLPEDLAEEIAIALQATGLQLRRNPLLPRVAVAPE